MKYYTLYRGSEYNIIKYFDSLQELNDYYGFRYKETQKFPDIKENVMGIYSYMIIDKTQ